MKYIKLEHTDFILSKIKNKGILVHTTQFLYSNGQWSQELPISSKAQLVFVFGDRQCMKNQSFSALLRTAFPHAEIVGCTTSGEIFDTEIYDASITVTALEFVNTPIEVHSTSIHSDSTLQETLSKLVSRLSKEKLRHVIVIANGQGINGSELAHILSNELLAGIPLTGGLAGDDDRFEETMVWHNEWLGTDHILVCGFYGDSIQIKHGSSGGWREFGPKRLITKSKDNVLFELDGESALVLYKEYLGEFAEDLPASGLLFPLNLTLTNSDECVVRTILNINEEEQSLTFAGNLPEGAYVTLMRSNTDSLIVGAENAAKQTLEGVGEKRPEFALLISCVGRRLVLQQDTESELESVQGVLSSHCTLAGFYSYGELSPINNNQRCELHNQTMTITTFRENSL